MPRPRIPDPKPAPDRLGVRVNLTLTPELVRTLDRIADRTGSGRATILREMLESALPTFVEMADALDLAAERKVDAFNVLAKTLDEVSGQASQLSLDIKRTRRRAMRRKKAT
jgi:predicted DNA-binding protein